MCLGCLLLGGCNSTSDKEARSAAITADGSASIENFTDKGLNTTRIFVLKIDGVLTQPKGMKGVFPLTAARHEILAAAHWGRMSLGGLFIDAGEAKLSFEAAATTRYRLRGQKFSEASASVWVEEVGTGWRVAEASLVLTQNRHDVPSFAMPIPNGK